MENKTSFAYFDFSSSSFSLTYNGKVEKHIFWNRVIFFRALSKSEDFCTKLLYNGFCIRFLMRVYIQWMMNIHIYTGQKMSSSLPSQNTQWWNDAFHQLLFYLEINSWHRKYLWYLKTFSVNWSIIVQTVLFTS